MKKIKATILTLLILQATVFSAWSAVSRTVSYTISVTIPPHVQTVSVTPMEDIQSSEEIKRQNIIRHQDYMIEEIVRAEETILLRTFVVR